jgi:hypothetical protein
MNMTMLLIRRMWSAVAHNDRLGNAAGDQILRDSAHQLVDAVMPLGGGWQPTDSAAIAPPGCLRRPPGAIQL